MNPLDLKTPQERTLPYALALQAKAIPDDVFLRTGERRITFGEADETSNAVARGLQSLGVGRGDRVAFFTKEAILETVLLTFAVNKLGAIWVPVNTDYKGAWLEDLLVSTEPKVIVTDSVMAPRLMEVVDRVPHEALVLVDVAGAEAVVPGATSYEDLTRFPSEPHDLSGLSYGDTASILWTSGTTGKSKGVMQSHNVWLRNGEGNAEFYRSREGDVAYNVMPIYNTSAWVHTFRAVVEGITIAFDIGFSVKNFWDRCRYYGATQIATLGAMHMFLWQQPERPDDADNPVRCGNVIPLPEEIVHPFMKRFGMEAISHGFGQSEAQLVLKRHSRAGTTWMPNALGIPYANIELKLLDDDGTEVPVGEVGEFCIRPLEPFIIFNGYFNNPEATREAFIGEWYRMGDLGRGDEDGNFFFVDRKKDAIRHKARNISTMEVESVVRQHPDVEAVAAYGIRSKELESESELAVQVVLRPGAGLTHEALAEFINANAPYYFVPRYIEFVQDLPYTPTGKVQKYLLRERGVTLRTWDLSTSAYEVVR